jgi:hypothetical protein
VRGGSPDGPLGTDFIPPQRRRWYEVRVGCLVVVVLALLPLAGLAWLIYGDHRSSALKELAGEKVWDEEPEGSARWESSSYTHCENSDRYEGHSIGLFVRDATEAVDFYRQRLVDTGWAITESPDDVLEFTGVKVADDGTTKFTIRVQGSLNRHGITEWRDGREVVGPPGFDVESDYVEVIGHPEPQCQ